MNEWILVPFAYLFGNFQPGLLIVRLTHGVDIRNFGSGRTGATNVLRTAGKAQALIVLVLDIGKGLVVAIGAKAIFDDPALEAALASSVILGHIFPLSSGFKGGRGVATGVGAATGLFLPSLPVGLLIFLPVVLCTRYVSLGSITSVLGAMVSFGVGVIWYGLPLEYAIFSSGCGSLIIIMHRDNIGRLLKGNERKIGR
ncbi:MAG: acyl-phosphate glycerol 3-phosphate acyltransferase [Chloroflexi bacterium]|nr:acyl-phosphate glycerol 3-phosphate acyltransferase [Chloroflexota bacterium]